MSKQNKKFCTQHVVSLYFSGNSMNYLISYCGLTDARIRASEKDLPVQLWQKIKNEPEKKLTKLGTIIENSLLQNIE